MFDLGIQELIVIFVVALIVFGPKRLPELGRSLGKGLAELKKAMQGVKEQMDVEMLDMRKPISLDDDVLNPDYDKDAHPEKKSHEPPKQEEHHNASPSSS
jgi:TatA/E family protein of Tat protein translocase